MKNLKRITLLVFILISVDTLKAQKFGIIGGLDLTKMSISENRISSSPNGISPSPNGESKYKHTLGHHIGITLDIPFSDRISLQPALLYSTKGVKYEESYSYSSSYYDYMTGNYIETTTNSESTLKIKASYLELPVNLKLSFPIGAIKVFGAFGPYLAWGFSGSIKGESSYNYFEETEKTSIEYGIAWGTSSYDMLRRLDYGIGYGLGIELNSFQIGASYNQGLANISANNDYGNSIKNSVIRLSVTYFVGKGKIKED